MRTLRTVTVFRGHAHRGQAWTRPECRVRELPLWFFKKQHPWFIIYILKKT
jgi:hypothetical protein